VNEAIGRVVVIGIGNLDRGDDAAGRLVARKLRKELPDGIEFIELEADATALLEKLAPASRAVLIDACTSGRSPGTVQRFDVAAQALPKELFNLSTHGFGLGEAVELARTLNMLPARCIVYAIEAEAFEPGASLSPAVEAAIDEVAARISAELG